MDDTSHTRRYHNNTPATMTMNHPSLLLLVVIALLTPPLAFPFTVKSRGSFSSISSGIASTSASRENHRISRIQRSMFSTDENQTKDSAGDSSPPPATPKAASPLQTVSPLETTTESTSMDTMLTSDPLEVKESKSIVKNLNTGEIREVKWVDPAGMANSNPLMMNWWAFILFGFPFVVLLNDVFHFLPTEGPLGFLGRI